MPSTPIDPPPPSTSTGQCKLLISNITNIQRYNRSQGWPEVALWPSEDFPAYSIILKSKLFALRYCGDFLPDDIISTGERFFCRCIFSQPRRTFLLLIEMYSLAGNVMTLKFLSDASVTAGGFQLKYNAIEASKVPRNYSNYFNWAHRGELAFLMCTVHLLIFIFYFSFSLLTKIIKSNKMCWHYCSSLIIIIIFHSWAHTNNKQCGNNKNIW